MNFTHFFENLWMSVFGTLDWHGLNMGFWVSMIVVALIVVVQNAVFWGMKPLPHEKGKPAEVKTKK